MKRILVQARHRPPLEPGHEGATGAPGEAALVEEIQASLVGPLENDPRFEAVPVPGRIPPGLDVDAAIFLHADGAATPRASGYCFGDALFPVNRRLADLIAAEIERLPGDPPRRADSYTVNLAKYYGFRRVVTDGPEVVVEHGFVTNPGERHWLRGHVPALAAAECAAVCRFFGLEPGRATPPGSAVTVGSLLLAPPRATLAQVQRHLTAPDRGLQRGRRPPHRPALLRRRRPGGARPLLAAAQMALETGYLTSVCGPVVPGLAVGRAGPRRPPARLRAADRPRERR